MPTAQLRSKSPFTTDGTATPVPSRSGFPSAEGWHAPACRGGLMPQPILWATHPRDENAPMPTASGGGCRALHDGGGDLSPEALAKGDTSNQ